MRIEGPHTLLHNSIISCMKDFDGNVWFGTGSGFSKFENNKFSNYDQLPGEIKHN